MPNHNRFHSLNYLSFCALFLGVVGAPALAATFVFHAQYTSHGGAVLLGQIAEITDCDETTRDALARLELFPAPPLGEVKFVSQQDVREILALRGIDTTVHLWQGARQVRVVTSPQAALTVLSAPEQATPVSPTLRARAESRLKKAIHEYMKSQYPQLPPCESALSLTAEDVRWLAAADAAVEIDRDQALAPDRRVFAGVVKAPGGVRAIQVEAQLQPRLLVVVAARPLARDTVLTRDDVRLADDVEPAPGYATRLEDVLGRQLTTGVAPGRPIVLSNLREPVLVRRGEVVQIAVRAPGVMIRTLGRAKDDGVLGHLVPVETLDNRGKTILGKVVDHQLVEVYAVSTQAATTKQ
ncbi:MAG: flagellar basal body P-ring formation protein FlgA [Thermogutta sp.]|uniref:flagellar basal body P-ring formation chaperone FlgA n=1 Tax=Thermogutta sp. TaxID=1962930 RepID=UPI0019C984C8|nr:flagellar basal body P-ring formation chaperone FlgA [Thermogutta sp.]MBC7352771.1 flagellar basal body P-ring formation protein FlgA [Thermogutta sp.]